MASPQVQSKRPEETKFKQQQLDAWQPILTPKSVILTFFSFAVLFIPIGVIILVASNNVKETDVVKYHDLKEGKDSYVVVEVPIKEEMEPPIYVYYELTNFFQNHRRYVKSRSDKQLRGEIVKSYSSLQDCDPLIKVDGAKVPENYYNPCGLIANSFFNDTFEIEKFVPDNQNLKDMTVTMDETGIAWKSDKETKFQKPSKYVGVPPRDVKNWDRDDFANEHFMVWMRTAGLPDFRKLYGKINTKLYPGTLKFRVKNEFNVTEFGGTKGIVLSTTTWIGGKNDFLAYAYIVVGVICVVLGFLFLLKNHFSPRQLGDPRYLAWNRGQ